MKDWSGKKRSTHAALGARNYALNEREINDYYATEPKALELIINELNLDKNVWECACGEGHLSEVLRAKGFSVKSTDLIFRNYGVGGVDFLKEKSIWDGDILTNPPYKYAKEFVEHALEIITEKHKVVMFLKLQFLEGKARRKMFEKTPPKYVYVSSSRLHCAMNGDFEKYSKSNAVCYCWFVWEKGFCGEPTIKWFN